MSYPFTLDISHADDTQACFMVTLAGLAIMVTLLAGRLAYLGIMKLARNRQRANKGDQL